MFASLWILSHLNGEKCRKINTCNYCLFAYSIPSLFQQALTIMKYIIKLTIILITFTLVSYDKTYFLNKQLSQPEQVIFIARKPGTPLSRSALDRLAENITIEIVTPSITTGGGRFTPAGSGVIIAKKDSTYYVLTVDHIFPYRNDYRVIVRSKKPGEGAEVVKLETIRRYPKQDLAVVSFASLEEYKVSEVGEASQLSNNSQVYVGGWPGKEDREGFQFTPAKVTNPQAGDNLTYQPTEPGENVYRGMSGGAVLNEAGHLIGIHVGLTEHDGDGKGVLISTFLPIMPEEVGEILLRPTPVATGENPTVTNPDNAILSQTQDAETGFTQYGYIWLIIPGLFLIFLLQANAHNIRGIVYYILGNVYRKQGEYETPTIVMPSSSTIDILIITALKDELDALKNCDNQSGNSWQELKDSSNYSYYKGTLNHKNGTQLNIVAARPVEMGEIYTSNLVTRLISELKPRCLAMTGVCAGNKKDVFLGDVIVANQVFKFDYGKLVAHYESIDNQQIRTEEIFHNIRTYNLKRQWELAIQEFPQDWLNTIQTSRPKSYYHQERWLLHKLYDYQQQPYKYLPPQHHSERQTECRDWSKVIQRLEKQKLLKIDPFELTEEAVKKVKNERLKYLEYQHYKDPSSPKIHTGVIATTSKVQQDPQLFQRIEKLQRKILGVEMEGTAIGAVAEIEEIPMIIVKAVQDYADHDKNDLFREYVAEVSARFLLAFFTTI